MLRAAIILIFGMSLVPFGDTAGKLLIAEHGVAPLFVAWSRFLIGALLLVPFVLRSPVHLAAFADWRVWLRTALIASAIISILTALRTEPLPNVFGAFFVGPIFSYVLSVLLLKEQVTVERSLLVLVGLAAVLLIVRPGFGMTVGLGFALLAGLLYGAYLTASRWLHDAAPPHTLLLAQLIGGTLLTLPFGLVNVPAINPEIVGLVVWSAAASMGGNLLLIVAYQMAPATRLAPFVYFQLVFAVIYGWLFFSDFPDAVGLLGLALLILSGLATLLLRR